MLFQSLRLKNYMLDERIKTGKEITEIQLAEYLDNILFCAEITEDVNQLRKIFILFRKWYNLSIHLHGYFYDKTVISCSIFDKKVEESSYHIENIINTISKSKIDSVKSKYIHDLAKYVNPYTTFFKEDLQQIDKSFYEKYSVLETLIEASDAFKISKLNESKEKYLNVIYLYEKKNELDNTMLYFYSWAIHGLGNIEYVKYNYGAAYKLYKDSLRIKEQIENLPSLILYSTKAKLAVCTLPRVTSSRWNKNIYKLYVRRKLILWSTFLL